MTPSDRVRESWLNHAREEFLRERSPLYWEGMDEYNYVRLYADRILLAEQDVLVRKYQQAYPNRVARPR